MAIDDNIVIIIVLGCSLAMIIVNISYNRTIVWDDKSYGDFLEEFESEFTNEKHTPNKEVMKDVYKKNVQKYTATNKDTLPRAVILTSQGRSGSTLVGNILMLDRNVFYVFEPLFFLEDKPEYLTFIDGKRRYITNHFEEIGITLMNLLTCNITAMPLEFFRTWGNDSLIQGHQLLSFYKQFDDEAHMNDEKLHHPFDFQSKMRALASQCLQSSHVIVKTIRTPIFVVQQLLARLSNLITILLVRDPRAIIMSQHQYFYEFEEETPPSSLSLSICRRMISDVSTFRVLSEVYQDRLTLLVYEDLVQDMYYVSQNLYSFVNLNFSVSTEIGINKMISVNSDDPFVPFRNNPKEMSVVWRKYIDLTFMNNMDLMCMYLYREIGYCVAESESILRNTSFPLYHKDCKLIF